MRPRPLTRDDAPLLHDLFVRASDFFELCDGGPPRDEAALEELTHVPDGFPEDALHPFGLFEGEAMIACVTLVRDPRTEAGWWIALMLLDPPNRGSGLGAELFAWTRAWLAEQGADTIWIGVVVANERARRFWLRCGFEERATQPYTSASGYQTEVVVMRRGVAFP